MTFWLILGAYVLGWLAAIRPAMKRRMLQDICVSCDHHGCADSCRCRCGVWEIRKPPQPRGAVFERDGRDAAAAVWFAMWWPFWLVFVVLRQFAAALGAGVKAGVLRTTPLTQPELERRLKEQQAEIRRLTAEIGRQS